MSDRLVAIYQAGRRETPAGFVSSVLAQSLIEYNLAAWCGRRKLIVKELKPEPHPQRLHSSAECDQEFRLITIVRDIIRRTVTDMFRDEYAENGYN